MKWVFFALGCVAILVVLVVLVGSLLPKGHVVSRQAHFHRTADDVFRIVTDFQAAPSWRRDVKQVDLLPDRDGKPVFREQGKNGPLVMVVDEKVSPRRLVTRIVDQSSFGGTWTYELTPEEGGCRLEITERGEVYNPVFRVMGRLFFSPTATMDQYLSALDAKLAQG